MGEMTNNGSQNFHEIMWGIVSLIVLKIWKTFQKWSNTLLKVLYKSYISSVTLSISRIKILVHIKVEGSKEYKIMFSNKFYYKGDFKYIFL